MFNDLNNMKSFSLDIPVLKETIAKIENSIKNIEKIGTDVENIGDRLVSESWEGQATNSFIDHQQNWKKGYDEMLNQLIEFKESLEKVVLNGAAEINELALELPVPLGGSKGAGYRNIISMEQEGIEELKEKCKTLVYEDYEEQREIMGTIESLSSKLNYSFSIGAEATKNKKKIEENQEKLQAFKTKLQNYEDRVLLFEQEVVDEMSKYAVVCGQKLTPENFRVFLQYQKDDGWKALLSKNVEELSDIEKLVLKAEYESGITDKISQYINKKLGIEDLTFESLATIWARNRKIKLGGIIDEVSIILNKLEMAESAIELKLGIDIKSVIIPTAALKVLKEINQAVDMQGILKNVDIQEITKSVYNGLASVIANTQFDKIINISNNSLDGIVAFIQDKEYTWEDKGALYSLNQAFDKAENCEDKFAEGNMSGAYLNLGGEFLGFLQAVYLNYENNCDSLENGHGFQSWKRKMEFSDWEEEYYGSRGEQPLSERISEDNKFLGFTYGFVMQIVTDPLTWIGGAVGAGSKMGKASKADDLLKGTKEIAEKSVDDIVQKGAKVTTEAAEKEIPKVGKEFDTVLKQGDELDNIIKGGSKTAQDVNGIDWYNYFRETYGKSNVCWENVDPTEVAKAWQGKAPYVGIDDYVKISLHDGDIIYVGEPFPTGYATTVDEMDNLGNDAKKIFEGLQVKPYYEDGMPYAEYRANMTPYKVNGDLTVAGGKAKNNPQFGDGDVKQLFDPNFDFNASNGLLTKMNSSSISLTNTKVSLEDYYKMIEQLEK